MVILYCAKHYNGRANKHASPNLVTTVKLSNFHMPLMEYDQL